MRTERFPAMPDDHPRRPRARSRSRRRSPRCGPSAGAGPSSGAGRALDTSLYLVRGYMCRTIDNNQGDRQLVSIQVPGDFVDLHGYPLKVLDHDVSTLTEVEVALVPHANLDALVAEEPVARPQALVLDAARRGHPPRVDLQARPPARRTGASRTFSARPRCACAPSTSPTASAFALPLTQPDIAEICGLTSIHVNRVLRDLRERGLVTIRGGFVEIRDAGALARLGEFESAYLYIDQAAVASAEATRRHSNG